MGSYHFYAIGDDSWKGDAEYDAPIQLIRFVDYQYASKIDDLLAKYQKGKDPITWDDTIVKKEFHWRQINNESVDRFVKWLWYEHKIKSETVEYWRAKI